MISVCVCGANMCRWFDGILCTSYYRSTCLCRCCSSVWLRLLQTIRRHFVHIGSREVIVFLCHQCLCLWTSWLSCCFWQSGWSLNCFLQSASCHTAAVFLCGICVYLCVFSSLCVCIPDSNRVLCPVFLLTGLQTSQPRFTADNWGEELISFGVVWYSCTCVYYAG